MLLFKQPIKKPESGAVLVEFAFVVPLLLLLVVGFSELGFAFYHLNILNKSVQDAARYFSDPLQARKGVSSNAIDVSSGNPAVAKAINLVIYGNTDGTGSSLMPTSASNYTPTPTVTSPIADHISVNATYQHNFISGNTLNRLTSGTIPSVYNLTASSVLRVE